MTQYQDYDDDYEDYDSDEETETIPCSNCQAQIYEDAESCPECGEYVIRNRNTFADKPIWMVVIICLIIGFLVLSLALPFL